MSLGLIAGNGAFPFLVLDAARARGDSRRHRATERCTIGGIMHGGALMGLADNCGGICAFLNLPEGAQATATIESKTNFLRAVREGQTVTATTRPLHKGRSMIVLETELHLDDGKLAGKVTQTQTYNYPRG